MYHRNKDNLKKRYFSYLIIIMHICKPGELFVNLCGATNQSTQNLTWCENSHPRNPRIEFKINCQFLKLMGKVLYAAANMATGMNDANTTEQSGRIAYPCGFSEEHWR